jgi:hypothetical protein
MMFWTCDPAVIILTPARVSQVDLPAAADRGGACCVLFRFSTLTL